MTTIKVRFTRAPHLLNTEPGDTFEGYPIKWTAPGGENGLVDIPDSFNPDQIDAMVRDWQRRGLVRPSDESGLWRPEKEDQWFPAGEVVPIPLGANLAPGDMFGHVGVDPTTQRLAEWGKGILIGICDTGCDGRHEWFEGKGFQGDLVDGHGHGTHVSGTCAGAFGIASDAVVLMRNVLPGGSGSESGIAAGIMDCANRGAVVINLSLGGTTSSIIDDAVRYAQARGVIVVAAAGNGGGVAVPGSPARVADVIVMAYTRDEPSTWANFTDGRQWSNPNRGGAPGWQIISAKPGGGEQAMSGTSMASPHVTGVIALLRRRLSREEALRYIWAHRGQAPDGLGVKIATDFAEIPIDPPPPPPPPPGLTPEERFAEIKELGEETLRVFNEARFVTRGLDNDRAWSQIGSDADYLSAIIQLATPPKVEPPPPPPPPPPAAIRRAILLFPGGGWMPPGPIPLDFDVENIAQWWSSLGLPYYGGTYRGGTGVLGVAQDMAAQIRELCSRYDEVIVAGHSAGGTALWALLDPQFGIPPEKIAGFVSIAGAALGLQPSDPMPAGTRQLVAAAFGPQNTWVSKTPRSHLKDRARRFPIVVLQGDRDDQLPVVWAQRFVQDAQAAGYPILPSAWHLETGLDHFSVNPPANQEGAQLVRQMIASLPTTR